MLAKRFKKSFNQGNVILEDSLHLVRKSRMTMIGVPKTRKNTRGRKRRLHKASDAMSVQNLDMLRLIVLTIEKL